MGLERTLLFRLATNEPFERAVRSVPGGEAAARRAASRYVATTGRSEAVATAHTLVEQGHGVSVDFFGERVVDPHEADRVVDEFLALAAEIPRSDGTVWLSVDITHLALDAGSGAAADRLARIVEAVPAGARVQVGAEDAERTDAVLAVVTDVAERGLADRLGATLQATLHRSPQDVAALAGTGVHVRLVKGAYVERTGAHPYGEATDLAYLRLATDLAEREIPWSMATHDPLLREALLRLVGPVTVEQLLGVRPRDLEELHRRGVGTRVYVPYGEHWFRYWMRRVAESRGA